MNLRVILADDHPFVLSGVKAALASDAGICVVGEASTPSGLIDLLKKTPCDVLVTDLTMPDPDPTVDDGMSLVQRIADTWPALRIVVLTGITNGSLLRALHTHCGVAILDKIGVLTDLPATVRAVAAGQVQLSRAVDEWVADAPPNAPPDDPHYLSRLTSREAWVVRMFAQGNSIAKIAVLLDRDPRVVHRLKRAAMIKLGVTNDPALFTFIRRQASPGK
ncbi:response regulator [Paraburkholderia sp.]|uniref:response regulator n=1 Tax=Paraburkholderia sp. TaxID=1926495 RepID=UPI002383FFFA|nr:response regulator [Paraburkholderia sp.]MDE1179620.1 response regulator [Paraburkholderia sp.]